MSDTSSAAADPSPAATGKSPKRSAAKRSDVASGAGKSVAGPSGSAKRPAAQSRGAADGGAGSTGAPNRGSKGSARGAQGGKRPAAATEAPVVAADPADGSTGRNLRRAIRLLYGEAIAVGAVALLSIWLAAASDTVGVSSAFATVGFAALCAAILAGLATALARRKSLARGPAIVVQMLLVPIGGYMIAGGLAWLGVPVLVVGLLGSGFLLAPSTRTALGLD